MPMNTIRQLRQQQPKLVFEYLLLHDDTKDSPANTIDLVRPNPELCDFYEVNIPWMPSTGGVKLVK
ncbi:hypothetical protein CBP27_02970 [Fischerella thermalis WC542]|jgi:hypothetical protein|nr:hypothetical protein CBP18_21430 [Fischerella thermalis WC119]PLZ08456.1 hypothetical protein CBP19_16945 [Fischerella thermalis WC1110]PLZ12365.1 hypothetical protein CBP17_07900 [Fischerella thermalis WC114]PLZ21417.1 hypothetical protein CBP30_08580 [Fischerella thermalis WC157]PLZ21916.1 hypothetical protein CBP29_14775 [Fischerella thermalis WC341]PLZ29498.1 hypothetical protein CBP28_10105 [Fischerella thermalis WC559]PLZ35773.1 hypothetical protein CBP10_02760 [Fischerella thermalis